MTAAHTLRGRSISAWEADFPVLGDLMAAKPTAWVNPRALATPSADALAHIAELPSGGLTRADVGDAEARLLRFAPFIAEAFPETRASAQVWGREGIIESPLAPLPAAAKRCGAEHVFGKLDSHLPISGSIKARGGIYEVLVHAERLAVQAGLIAPPQEVGAGASDYTVLASPEARELFGRHRIAVGSTGNLGLSIGIMSATLGFQVSVHMSADARQWKKNMLRSHGVTVVEYEADYSVAVAEARREAAGDDALYFIDDENSRSLFLGYAVAARRLRRQLAAAGRTPSLEQPLIAYLPCGVGGGPGGVAFGLATEFGDAVRCVFVEPTQSPSMLLGVLTGGHETVSVRDIGLTNFTAADGLACASPSGFVGSAVEGLVDAYLTVTDEDMFRWVARLADADGHRVEPSSASALDAMSRTLAGETGVDALADSNATHLVWLTGGSMVPEAEMDSYVQRGRDLGARA